MKIKRPDQILQTLRQHGYEACYVGGCVRDTLLGREIHDWDIATSALPEQTMACFDHCVPTGIRHGTVTVLLEDVQAEVTTFRTDGEYLDGRHPEDVTFVRTLAEDLARRDFTVNAMAMDDRLHVTDLYGGREDLEKKCIRCVGEPDKRFREDALRMLRALRFSAQLGFEIEPETAQAIARNGKLCDALSAERVRDEIEKTICSQRPQRAGDMARLGLLERFSPDMDADLDWLAQLPQETVIRWAALFRMWRQTDPALLRLSKKVTLDASEAGRIQPPTDQMEWKRLIARHGNEKARIVAALEGQPETVDRLLNSGMCLSLRQLAVTGSDLPHLTGPQIGEHLWRLLDHVLEHPEDNRKEILLKLH